MSYLAPSIAFAILSITSALATATARIPSTTGGSASMTPLMLGDGGLAQYWWLVLVVLLAAAAFWYVLRRNSRTARQ
jgi:predicted ABC-type sugar transport system permease subunit